MNKKELEEFVDSNIQPVKLYWSRMPGRWVHPLTGDILSTQPEYPGTIREWYEALFELVFDAAERAKIGKEFCVSVGGIVLTILESGVLYKPYLTTDADDAKVGVHSNRIEVYKNLEQPEDVIFIFSKDKKRFAEVHILNLNVL